MPAANHAVGAVALKIASGLGRTIAHYPATIGVPFCRGAAESGTPFAVVGPDGRSRIAQTRPLAFWPDGSVRWMLVDFIAHGLPPGESTWRLVSAKPETPRASGLSITETSEQYVVDAGAARFVLDRRRLRPFVSVLPAGSDKPWLVGSETLFLDVQGRAQVPNVTRSRVESRGPVRGTICLEGGVWRNSKLQLAVRLDFFAATPLVKMELVVHNPRRARHRGGLWDLGDSGSLLFKALATNLAFHGPSSVRWTVDAGATWRQSSEEPVCIYQDSSGGKHWESSNHVNRDGKTPCRFCGFSVTVGSAEHRDLRASPAAVIGAADASVCVAMPEFWQQFPKSLSAGEGKAEIGWFPGQWNDLFELQGGEQKTLTAWLDFSRPGDSPGELAEWVHRPPTVMLEPEHVAATAAVPFFTAASSTPDRRLADYLREAIDGPVHGVVAKREQADEYGWRNYGDWFADHEVAYYRGPRPLASHYNNQFDIVYGLLLHFWRTGDPGSLALADSLARHVIDIDIYHTDDDKAAYNHGLFWFTDHYLHARTSTHRTYSRHNRPASGPYGGGPGAEHNFSTGLLYYYFLTGSPHARRAVLELAEWVIQNDDGLATILGIVDPAFTGRIGDGTIGRAAGNSLNVLCDAWLATGEQRYGDKAEALVRRTVHPADDVAARELLEIERNWSYTVFLSALARYLAYKIDLNQLDGMYAYGRECLLHYAEWMLEHERPYFEQQEKMEFPTEAWAAQESRKANVFRLAAVHADEPLRRRLLEKGTEFMERAWSDLSRFETRYAARAVAIVMTEGAVDLFFRSANVPRAPRPEHPGPWPPATLFVGQRDKVVQLMRSPGGFVRLACRLINPGRWLSAYSHRVREKQRIQRLLGDPCCD